MSTKLTTAEQLSSLASAIKAYTDAKQQETIDRVKDETVALVIEALKIDPELALSATTVDASSKSQTVTVSYLGEGTITLSNDYGGSPTYDSATKTITIPSSSVAGGAGTITVSLSATGIYNAATATIAVTLTDSNLIPTPDTPLEE